tara:strand:+ start:210 stop:434 length:225 start_codon:yes stop_codon:yes gene_type:complete
MGFFAIILSLLLLVLFYINKHIKTFIDIEHDDMKMYIKLFGTLFIIIFILLFVFTLHKSLKETIPDYDTGDPGF